MGKIASAFVLVFSLAVSVSPARGAEPVELIFPTPKTSYTAEDKTTFNGDGYEYKVYYAPGMMRSEFDVVSRTGQKTSSVAINRIDKKLSWTMQPAQKTYVTMKNKEKVPTAMLQTDGLINVYIYKKAEQSKAGSEEVNGVRADKYKVKLENPDGSKLTGFVWRTKQDVTLKMDLEESPARGTPRKLSRELKNVKFGRLDPRLFEIPDGFVEAMSGYVRD